MRPDEINRAIAEHIGARFFTEDGGAFWHFVTSDGRQFGPPTEDLNAMHEAEKTLTDVQCLFYPDNMREVITEHEASRRTWHATASQRAEAFLRTIGKWRDA